MLLQQFRILVKRLFDFGLKFGQVVVVMHSLNSVATTEYVTPGGGRYNRDVENAKSFQWLADNVIEGRQL